MASMYIHDFSYMYIYVDTTLTLSSFITATLPGMLQVQEHTIQNVLIYRVSHLWSLYRSRYLVIRRLHVLYILCNLHSSSQSMQLNGYSISLVIRRLQVVHICNLHSSQSMQLNGQSISLVIKRLQVVYVTFTHHLSPCSSMVRASHWSSEGYKLYTYVTFTHNLSPCSSIVRASHWLSKGYRLYTYVT